MKILLSNDDGVHAKGIKILADYLQDIADITIVAPAVERSTTGHTLSIESPLRIEKIEKNTFSCSGFPADCILMGLGHILKNSKVDLVISGINRGANLGQDTYYSGTVAAARESIFRGTPSIAISLVTGGDQKEYYETAAKFIRDFIRLKRHMEIPRNCLLNINVPNLPESEIKGVDFTTLGYRSYSGEIVEREDVKGRPYYWIAGSYTGFREESGSDCVSISQSRISVTPLKFLTDRDDQVLGWSKLSQGITDWPM